MKKTLLLISTRAITLNNFFDKFIRISKFNFILGCYDPNNLKYNNRKIKLHFDFSFFRLINPLFFFLKLFKNYKILNEIKPDYILINTPLASLYIRLVAFFLKKKSIYIVHGFRFHKSEYNLKSILFFIYEKFFSFMTSHYIVMNKEDLSIVKHKFKFSDKKILRIPSIGISYKKLKRIKTLKKNKTFNVGVIAAYRDNKGYLDLIKIAKNIQKKKLNIKFHCYGYDDKKKYLDKIKKLNLNNIILNNYNDKIYDKIKYFDLVCHLSRREGKPISLLESILIGVPVIGFNIRGNNEIIYNNFNGILIKPFELDNFERRLIELSKNLKKLKYLKNNCKKSIKSFHDKQSVTLMLNKFLANVK